MAGDETAAGARRPSGLLGSLKNLTGTLLGVVQTRLQLLANEIHEEKLRLAQIAVYAVAAVFFLVFGILLSTLFVIVLFWDSNRLLAIGAFAGIYLLFGSVLGMMALNRANTRSRLFEHSLRELDKDRERLSS
jgi:uncharacterized membrane protein YqjE